MEKDNLVSIILPSYNVEKYIAQTIESVIAQTWQDWELVVTDDCSTDSTVGIIRWYKDRDSRIKLFVFSHNTGAGAARNHSIEKAEGRYIAFLDADDWWYPNKLQVQMDFMRSHRYEFVFSAFEYADESLNVTGVSYKPKRISHCSLKIGNNIGTPGVIYDTLRIGKLFMPNIRKRQDWAMWLQITERSGYAYSVNLPLWKYRLIPASLSSDKRSLMAYNLKIYTDFLGYSKLKALLIFYLLFLPNQLKKVIKNRIDSFFYVRNIAFESAWRKLVCKHLCRVFYTYVSVPKRRI